MKITVDSSTSTSNGNFCNKLIAETKIATPLGNVTSRQTYYMFTDQQNQKGLTAEIDLNQFDVVNKEFIVEETGEVMNLKYIYPQR